jgi:hypothetical protein
VAGPATMTLRFPSARQRLQALRAWPAHRWPLAASAAFVAALALGIPTGIVPTPFYTRMTPVLWWNYPVLAISAVLLGLTVATYLRPPLPGADTTKAATGGGLLTVFAVGCPICNKPVVFAVGATGALRWFAPLQPLLAATSLVLLSAALWTRLGGEAACRIAAPEAPLPPA